MNKTLNKLNTGYRLGLWGAGLLTFAAFALVFVGTELLLQALVFHSLTRRILYPILFDLCLAGVCTAICALLPPVLQKILGILFTAGFAIWTLTQYTYQAVFGAFMPMSQLVLGGNVVDFRSQLLYCIKQNVPQLLLLLAPFLIFLVLLILKKILRIRLSWRQLLAALALAVLSAAGAFILMFAARNTPASVYRMFLSPSTKTTTSYRNVGMVATTVQELRFMNSAQDASGLLEDPEPAETEEEVFAGDQYNVLPIDFDALAESTDDQDLKRLDRFAAGLSPSKKNDYTGLLEGGNVIVLCAESFSPLIISEELTPTLYKMTHGGFVFENYYGTFESVTTNGEYTTCTGLFPDLSRNKVASTFDESVGHYLPYCLGNALKDRGYLAYAYHNYMGEFYNRNLTHTNMGYVFKSASDGLDVTMQWPASDLEMMEKSVDDYIGKGKPFVAYYMTFSGHYQYDWYNAMSAKHRDRVKDLPYSDPVKAFIACNLEVEDAMTFLLERLEQAGILDKTLIVLTNDHYPYGLKENQYNELAGHPVDLDFEKYRNSFLCYTGAVQEPVIVDDYCCTADILPTILNLLGYDYDSRLLAGTDVLSDASHVAVLETGSFLTNDFRYNAETGVAMSHDGQTVIPDAEVEPWRTLVEQKMEYSREILNHDYYSHVFDRSGTEQTIEDAVAFDDVESIFAQAAVAWVVSNGYMDPISETKFGASDKETLGELADSLYRIAGRPETSENALPWDYASRYREPDGAEFNVEHPYHDGVCWAFEKGLIRADDRTCGFSERVSYMDIALLLYRFCELYDVQFQLVPEEESEEALMRELSEAFPDNTEEELTAMTWCFGEHIIATSKDLQHQIETSNGSVARGRAVTYLFRVCSYELHLS